MNYNQLEEYVLKIFKDGNFIKHWEDYKRTGNRKEINSQRKIVNTDLKLSINFPGYKTIQKHKKLIYDYRVDLNNIPISHTNIVIDIYNKCNQAPYLSNNLYRFLLDVSENALNTNLKNYNELLNFNFIAPSTMLLNRAERKHRNLNKYFNRTANSWNYSIEELKYLISYIVLQEDINYPMPKYNGRRMSFYRYIEAIICANNNNNYTLENVIERTLSHSRPTLWNINERIYAPITELGEEEL
ncbi:hypothetical protein E5N06_13325 [Clostridium perfringens]|nr:hypothetical protein [Clostridium perfringens]ELC8454817.1 hypothetical protein [Clostridium perfringens]